MSRFIPNSVGSDVVWRSMWHANNEMSVFANEIHEIAGSSLGQWTQAGLTWEHRTRQLDRAMLGLVGLIEPSEYGTLDDVLDDATGAREMNFNDA